MNPTRVSTIPASLNIAAILRDLTFVEDAYLVVFPDESINSAKLDLLYGILFLVRNAQLRFYSNLKVDAVSKCLHVHLERLP